MQANYEVKSGNVPQLLRLFPIANVKTIKANRHQNGNEKEEKKKMFLYDPFAKFKLLDLQWIVNEI